MDTTEIQVALEALQDAIAGAAQASIAVGARTFEVGDYRVVVTAAAEIVSITRR